MSFVSVTAELIEGAAQDLAGIRSSLSEAAAAATVPTTGVAAAAEDEVSIAMASLFGNFGQEFQAMSAQAQAFHAEFVSLMNAGAGAYVSAEAANVEQTLLGAANTASPAAPAAFLDGVNSFGATVAAPYQMLVSNTVANLQSLGGAITANPAPFLRQFVNNQLPYGQTTATGFQNAVLNLPAELANLPANIQAGAQGMLPAVQQFVNNEIGYAQLIATLAAERRQRLHGRSERLAGKPANRGADVMSGDVTGGLLQVGGAFLAPVFSGLNVGMDPVTGLLDIIAGGRTRGPVTDLRYPRADGPEPDQPAARRLHPGMVAQNATNLFSTLTDLSQTLDLNTGNLHVGLPLVLALDAIGPPVTTLEAIGSSAGAFFGAVQTGDGLGAARRTDRCPRRRRERLPQRPGVAEPAGLAWRRRWHRNVHRYPARWDPYSSAVRVAQHPGASGRDRSC